MTTRHSILIYCGDVLGLGHLRRNTAIASRLVEELPGANALLMTGLPTSCVFECPPGVDVVKLPSLSKDADGKFESRTLSVRHTKLKSVRSTIIEGLANSFQPDLVLVDHLPTGVWGELQPTLDRLAASPNRPCIVLGLRDILDAPGVIRSRWRDSGVYRAIERRYDSVLVYGSASVFDTIGHYGLNNGWSTGIEHCGYICSEAHLARKRPSRHELGIDHRPLIVITAGGGADGYPMMKLSIDALRCMPPGEDVQVVCITGPFMQRHQISDLRARAVGLPVNVLWCVDHVPSYFDAADLIVTMAGYNTLIEAVRLKKRTIVLPRSGPSAEQRMRAELFAARGLVTWLPVESSPADLARLMRAMQAGAAPTAELPDMDGLNRVAGRLREMLQARKLRPFLPTAEGQR